MALFPRSAELAGLAPSAGDADAIAGWVQLYAKLVDGQPHIFAVSGDGSIQQITGLGSIPVIVDYVATGSEGVDFMVSLGVTLANDTYGLLWSPAGIENLPILDLPNVAAGDRTTTQFRVLVAAPLAAGDQLTFIAFPR